MSETLFPMHDPGGLRRSRLLPGVSGDAEFSGPSDCYRTTLRRWRGDAFPARFALLVGMNPSTASATFNDPTIAREWEFVTDWGYDGFVKCNVADYRATNPSDLPDIGAVSPQNLTTILTIATAAEIVVLVHGVLPSCIREAGEALMAGLAGRELLCLGQTKDGWPRHPLYLRRGTPLVRFSP